jgi:hypothetical protein
MAYITREDGIHFVIPSYRDVLTVKQKSQLKKDILLLSQSYGEYITMQKKGVSQYEVAFSPDTGYLLGESIWNYFKRPMDMIYCERIPNSTEAILVVVKGGSVYLDGSFPIENISEELVIFLTQENNFEINVYGDVPISQTPAEGKFSFEPSSVKTFTILDKPVFPTLPLLKMYQLQLVNSVLKAQGIGVFPVTPVLLVIVLGALGYFGWTYLQKPPPPPPPPEVVNPYLTFNTQLNSPAPEQEIDSFVEGLNTLLTIPGWTATHFDYSSGSISGSLLSQGGKLEDLLLWGKANNVVVIIAPLGITVSMPVNMPPNRPIPTQIYPMKQVIAQFVDKMVRVYPGNVLKLGNFVSKGKYTDVTVTISVDSISPATLVLIGEQTKDLPFVLQGINVDVNNGALTGSINFDALGS